MLGGDEQGEHIRHDPFQSVPQRRRANLDWISCETPPDDLTDFERFTRSVDWENTYFGPVSQWDEQLRTAVLICLADPEPAALLWGDKQHMIYNEAYTRLIGSIHPGLQGQEPRPAFGVLWDDYEANYRTCAATGGFTSHPGLITMMKRHGYEEECYFSFKWAPYIGKDGNLAGVYASCSDTTVACIAPRRMMLLKRASTALANVSQFDTLWHVLSGLVKDAPTDLPSVLIYSKLGHGTSPSRTSKIQLAARIGVELGGIAAPGEIDLNGTHPYAKAMRRAAIKRDIVVLREADGDLSAELLSKFEPRSFGTRSTEVAVCPIFSGQEAVCYLIVGLNPKKRLNVYYETFLKNFVDDVVGAKLGGILLSHEKLRGRMLAQKAEDERNHRLRELEQSELKYRRFAEHAPLGMIRLDKNGDMIFCNAAWKEIFSYEESWGSARPWLNAMHPDEAERSRRFFNEIWVNEGPQTFEHTLRKRGDGGGHDIWVLVSGYREDDDHAICWVTDITAQKAAALALRDKMQEAIVQRTRQENFIDMISHEIRNPLSAVLHCSEDIIRCANEMVKAPTSNMSHAAHDCLESAQTISYCVEHQKRIIDDVLTLSKLDAELLEITLIPVEPRKAIRTALKIFDRELKETGIKLNMIEDDSLDGSGITLLMLDPNRFLQVLINLVTNSIKFTRTAQRREITITTNVSHKRPTPEGARFFPSSKRKQSPYTTPTATPSITPDTETIFLGIRVCDTGRGLSDHESQSLFNRFAQASPKTHIEYGGSGLGLFIARQIVELMGGQIGIKHEQDAGCTFAFYVETQRVAAAKDELKSGVDTLKINLTHHPVTPPMGTPANLTPLERAASPLAGVANISAQSPLSEKTGGVMVDVDASKSRTAEPVAKKKPLLVTPSVPVPTTAEPLHPSTTKVLVVEDNLINQKVVCKQLKNRGYIVHAANHGGEALAALHSAWHSTQSRSCQVEDGVIANQTIGRYFDIILCDLEMPVMDGIACAQEIRRLEGNGNLPKHVPMIAVTANARSKHVESALEAGMDDVTTKPYRMDELVAQMEATIGRFRTTEPDGG